jgi:hypothetical protein
MNNKTRQFSLVEAKTQAQILLKNLHGDNPDLATQAKLRIKDLPDLKLGPDSSLVKLKHALSVIAFEHGFSSWVNLKNYFTLTGLTQFTPGGGFINQWFNNYKDAKNILKQGSAYLLPYTNKFFIGEKGYVDKNQFFICEAGYIEFIGLDPNHPDWIAIGRNWVEPNDLIAWQHLNQAYIDKTQ